MSDYWDINQILTTEECIDCTFVVDGHGLGHLDPLRASVGAKDVSIFSLPRDFLYSYLGEVI